MEMWGYLFLVLAVFLLSTTVSAWVRATGWKKPFYNRQVIREPVAYRWNTAEDHRLLAQAHRREQERSVDWW